MATSGDFVCGVCEYKQISKPAEYWCSECDEGLCSSCEDHHGSSRATRKHGVLSLENYKKLPSAVAKITNHCEQHDSKYQNYCRRHDKLCCPVCISSTHKECKDIQAIEEIIKTAKMTSLLENMEESLKYLKANISSVIKDRTENLTFIKEQRKKYQDEIKQMRKRVMSHFDALEQHMLQELSNAEHKSKTMIETIITQLAEKSKTIEDLGNDIAAMKQFASPLQTFLGSKIIEKKVNKEDQYITSLSENKSLHQIELKVIIDDKISGVLSSISRFGTVTTETSPPSLIIKTGKEKQAQIMSSVPPRSPTSIEDIKVTIETKVKFLEGESLLVRGCNFLPDGRIIFADNKNKKLYILKENGALSNKISCQFAKLYDVTVIDDKTVAVAGYNGHYGHGGYGGIHIINIETEKSVKEIKINGLTQGIIYDNGSLLCCVNGKGILRIQLQTDNITTVVKQNAWPGWSYITLYGDNIYQTDSYNNTVTCYNMKGEKLWVFKDTSVLSCPYGVTVDNSGNVYIASYSNYSVVVLSPDGKKNRQLICWKDGLWSPRAINIDMNNRKLLIANYHMVMDFYTIYLEKLVYIHDIHKFKNLHH